MCASVILAAHNEGGNLLRTVGSAVTDLGGIDHEVIVADDGSTDGSVERVKQAHPQVRIVAEAERLGASPTKALGGRHARGDVLIFLDGHCKPEPGALHALIENVERAEGHAAVSPAVAGLDVRRWANKLRQVGHGYEVDLATLSCRWIRKSKLRELAMDGRPFYLSPALITCSFAVSRRLYERIGGFDAEMRGWGAADADFSLRVWLNGYRIIHDPEIVVGHRFRRRFDTYPVDWDDLMANKARTARRHFSDPTWDAWREAAWRRHAEQWRSRAERVWRRIWDAFEAGRADLEAESAAYRERRPWDEFEYAAFFALPWPRRDGSRVALPAGPSGAAGATVKALAASPSPSPTPTPSPTPSPSPTPPPPSPSPSPSPEPCCEVTKVTPSVNFPNAIPDRICYGEEITFTATGDCLHEGITWDATGDPIIVDQFDPEEPEDPDPWIKLKWITTATEWVSVSCRGTTAGARITIVGVASISRECSDPPDTGPLYIPLGESIRLRAHTQPSNVLFPDGSPTWKIIEKPTGSNVNDPGAGQNPVTVQPDLTGKYRIRASCGDSSEVFELHAFTVELDVGRDVVTLLHDPENTYTPIVQPPGIPGAFFRYEMRRKALGQCWYEFGLAADPLTYDHLSPGMIEVRVVAVVGDHEAASGEHDVEVRFPSYEEIVGDPDVIQFLDDAWQLTLDAATEVPNERREFGAWIFADTIAGEYRYGRIQGDGVWHAGPLVGPDERAELPQMGWRPFDFPFGQSVHSPGVFVVANFHTHTPTTYRLSGREVGPSEEDEDVAAANDVPGIVYDYEGDPNHDPPPDPSIPGGHPKNAPATLYRTHDLDTRRTTPP